MSHRHTRFELSRTDNVLVAALDMPGKSMNVVDEARRERPELSTVGSVIR